MRLSAKVLWVERSGRAGSPPKLDTVPYLRAISNIVDHFSILGSVAPGAFRAFHQNSLNVLSVLERSVRSERCVSERSRGADGGL